MNQPAKLWQGRTQGAIDPVVDQLNRSIGFDQVLYRYDIQGSIAHVSMLGTQGILPSEEAAQLIAGLESILSDIDAGRLAIDLTVEDIHTFVELTLTQRLGDIGKKVHTGRSRNDQSALDMRLHAREAVNQILTLIHRLQAALQEKAAQHQDTLMQGYTHLQAAQPISFGLHLSAYADMLARDAGRLKDCLKRLNRSPLGAGALAGTSYPINRRQVATALGFDGIIANPLDAVSSRDHLLEAMAGFSILMMHLSRLSEEVILWNTQAFSFITLDNAYTTGSSMMPQKKNPDVAELVRGKTGRVYGGLMTLLTVMKGLPLAYNKDMQEDKESWFDAVETVSLCLECMTGMIQTLEPNPQRMVDAARHGFLNATDLADYLVRKGMPFRDAYAMVGQLVIQCMEQDCTLENLPLAQYQTASPLFEKDVFEVLDLKRCMVSRRHCWE